MHAHTCVYVCTVRICTRAGTCIVSTNLHFVDVGIDTLGLESESPVEARLALLQVLQAGIQVGPLHQGIAVHLHNIRYQGYVTITVSEFSPEN